MRGIFRDFQKVTERRRLFVEQVDAVAQKSRHRGEKERDGDEGDEQDPEQIFITRIIENRVRGIGGVKAQIRTRDDEFGFFDFSFNTHRQHILYTQNARLANNFLPNGGKRLCKNWVKESFCRL